MPNSDSPVAIVTGGGRGLGREHALALARAGWAVIVNDLGVAGDGVGIDATPASQVVAEIEAMGGHAIADGSDVSDWNAAGGLVQSALSAFGRLDGLVNNAGCIRDRTLANMTEEDWDIAVRVNLKGAAGPLHHAARYWRDLSKQIGGPVRAAVVSTTSASGLYSATGQSNYAAAKMGVASLAVVAARELERYGVRVNAIAPIAATRLTEALMPEEMRVRYDPALVSPLVVYLLGRESEPVTGRIFEVGGGGVGVVDMPRPVAARLVEGARWTTPHLTEVVPQLVGQTPPTCSAMDAAQFMMAAPTEPKAAEPA